MFEISGVYKAFGDRQILKNINLSIPRGSVYGLIGPNGAGKTTLMKCIAGILDTDKGNIRINQMEIYENPSVKETIGFVPDQCNYFNTYRVKDIIKLYKLTYNKFNDQRYNEINKVFNISDNKFIRELSKGMKARLSIMLNLSIMPEVLIMDEPTSGLDPIVKREVMNMIINEVAERNTTIIISSHNLSDIERVCDMIGIIQEGEIKYSNSIEEMKTNIRKLQVVFKDTAPDDLKLLEGVTNVEQVGRVYYIITSKYSEDFKSTLLRKKAEFIEELDLSLEDMFLYSVGGDMKHAEIFKSSPTF